MKSKIACFIIFLFCSVYLSAQTPVRDSLLNQLQLNEQRDTTRIDILFDLFKFELSNHLDSALLAANEMLSISREIQDKRSEGLARLYKGIYYGKKTRYDKAITEGLASVELLEKDGKKEDLLLAKSELGSYYRVTFEPEKALQTSLEILDIVKTMPESPANGRYYFEVGNTYGTLKKFKEAEKYFQEAIDISKKFNFTPGEMAGKQSLVQVYLGSKEYEKLDALSEELIAYYTASGNKDKLSSNLYFAASAKMALNQHKEAIPLLETALQNFKEIKRDLFVEKAAQKLYICYSVMKEHEKADEANEIYLSTHDTIQSQKQKKLTEAIKEEYETDKLKQEKLIETERAQRNKKLFIVSTIAGLLLLTLSFLYIYQQKLKKRAELAEIKLSEAENKLALERKLNNAEMKALKAQMNPHFLFNAFNSIQEFIIMNNRELASNYLGKFADLMRLYLDHSREKTIPLQEEINATELYLELEKIRFEEKLNYTIDVATNVDRSQTYLPPMLIQPFIENSLKHGLLHKKDNRKLDIGFEMIENVLHCSIADNGIGRHKSALLNAKKLKKHKSFATSATQNRIELLNIGREQAITLQIIDLMDDNNEAVGTKVIIKIPNENV